MPHPVPLGSPRHYSDASRIAIQKVLSNLFSIELEIRQQKSALTGECLVSKNHLANDITGVAVINLINEFLNAALHRSVFQVHWYNHGRQVWRVRVGKHY